ncbi:hypothetical protein C475_21799 [Halosimplex carlsbadense 2-9-1]|uniref:Uncharacterized protein n=1 Tax=Halosimplex carlsbadense 2-9-1 TaxID=797114 RepID=M0C9M1_9EURY|nr:hypothetical protein [Halosimplex carlsbadense]ELZ19976.1 hypothetical protein C475_21799 [Halosimplex carlsbadense 2-9-1]
MSGGSSDDPNVESLRIAREEARRTLDAQLSTLDDIDAKALSVFRLNVAVVGVLLSVLSFAAASDATAVGGVLNPAVGAAAGLFVLSAAAAGLTYATAGQRVGADPSGLEEMGDRSETAALEYLVDGYADWIRRNQRTNLRKALLVTLAILGTVAGTLALGVGVVAAFTGLLYLPAGVAVAAVILLAAVVNLPEQIARIARDSETVPGGVAVESVDSVMSGQRAFKGCENDE